MDSLLALRFAESLSLLLFVFLCSEQKGTFPFLCLHLVARYFLHMYNIYIIINSTLNWSSNLKIEFVLD